MRKLLSMIQISIAVLLSTVMLLLSAPISAGGAGGKLLWEDRFDAGDFDGPSTDAVAVAGGRVFVAGGSTGAMGGSDDFNDLLVRAYDAKNGKLLWDDRFDLAAGDDFARGITTGGGRVFAVGNATNSGGILVPVIRAYDGKTGALLWQDVGANQGLFDQAAVHGGRVFVAGVIGEDSSPAPGASFFFRSDWLVRAYDVQTGSLLWEERFGAPDPVGSVQLDRPVAVAAGGGRVFVAGRGHSGPAAGSRWFVRAHDAKTGTLLWQDEVSGAGFGQANQLAVDGNRLVAVGTLVTQQTPFNGDWLIRTYDGKTGALLWQDVVDKGVSRVESARDVATSKGRVFVVGIGGATCRVGVALPNNCDALIRAYDLESGEFLWEDRFAEAPFDEFVSVAARGNRVFVVGSGGNDCDESGLPTNCDMIVRTYDADTGKLVWEDRVDKAGTDEYGRGVAVRGGRVFAVGTFFDADFSSDLLVRAYESGHDGPENDDEDE